MTESYNCNFIQTMLKEGAQLIDVRSTIEFAQGALSGAINMPIDSFTRLMADIDPNKPVLLYCRSGIRSGAVKNYLDQQGYYQVHNIGGYRQFLDC